MQKTAKNLTIGLAILFTATLAAYAFMQKRPDLQARHTPLTPRSELMASQARTADSLLRIHEDLQSELRYYLRAHRIDDEGYDMIANYNAHNDSIILQLKASRMISPIGPQWLTVHPSTPSTPICIIGDGGYWNGRCWQRGLPPFNRGLRFYQDGIYLGELDSTFTPTGHGSYKTPDGSYYEGEWSNGKQHGFGFRLRPFKDIQVGTWVEGKYKGERLRFTPERIYGIDISRYQHERGRHHFPIHWKALRITNLGKHNQQNVTGEADYPVSFIYIKATQGTTVTNRYFAADYKAARANGYHVGAYHFYSTTSDALEQADHFLKTARFNKGDFPPVFDVEPSDGQIEAMGGAKKLLSEMRVWLRAVERQTGIKPIIYVNQSFVNKYLQDAPDLKRGYLIWIARYSEYKPDVRLCWWQLSATGKVRGIEGDVDINVFNGYHDQWEEFLATELMP